jgi:HPt (histidine-containing phosphotransfer) domain-containing protein
MPGDRIPIQVDPDLEDLIPMFLENRESDIITLRRALAEGDFPTLRSLGHNMKGAGGGYGFDYITDLGGEIEACALRGDAGPIPGLVEALEDYLRRVDITFE